MKKVLSVEKKVWKSALKIILPIMISEMIFALVGFVDNFMIASYDSAQNHLIAIGVGTEMWFAIQAIYIAIGTLFGIFYAQFLANRKNFLDTFKINVYFATITMIIVSILMYFLASDLMNLFYLSDEGDLASKQLAIKYFKILALGNIFVSITYLLLNPLIIIGKTKYFMLVAVVSLIINIIFDYIFIFLIDKGSEGAAWATVLSYAIQLLITFYLLYINRLYFRGIGSFFKINKKLLRQVLKRIWIIVSVSLMTWSFVALTIIWSNMFGYELMKSTSIAYAVAGIMFTIFPAVNQSVKIIIGKKLGESKFKEATEMANKLLIIILSITFVVAIIGIIISFIFPKIFINNQNYQKKAEMMIQTFSVVIFVFVINSFYTGVIQAAGHQLQPAILNYYSQIWLIIPVAIIVGPWVAGANFEWTFILSQSSMIIPAILAFIFYKRDKWHINLNKSV